MRLEALLPSALIERIGSARSVLISAHEELNLSPWAMLPFGDRRLREVVPVGVMPNLAAITPMAARPAAAARIGILGALDESNTLEKDRPQATKPEVEASAECAEIVIT